MNSESMTSAVGLGLMCLQSAAASVTSYWIITFPGEFVARVLAGFGKHCSVGSLTLPGLSRNSSNQYLPINALSARMAGRGGIASIAGVRLLASNETQWKEQHRSFGLFVLSDSGKSASWGATS